MLGAVGSVGMMSKRKPWIIRLPLRIEYWGKSMLYYKAIRLIIQRSIEPMVHVSRRDGPEFTTEYNVEIATGYTGWTFWLK